MADGSTTTYNLNDDSAGHGTASESGNAGLLKSADIITLEHTYGAHKSVTSPVLYIFFQIRF